MWTLAALEWQIREEFTYEEDRHIMKRLNDARILMYSHDTFGLGHLRRCRTIAHALVERFKGLTVLIISGSQIAGAFGFKARVDFVKIPSVIKLYNGNYTSINEHIDIHDTLAMREALVLETARLFDPDIFIVDKEPLGLSNEIEATLISLQLTGCKTVLGLRDVMDSPESLKKDWGKRQIVDKIAALYDDVWIYGPFDFWNPLQGIDIPDHVRTKIHYLGFLERDIPSRMPLNRQDMPDKYILVTAGGGGDGMSIMSWVLAAREYDKTLTYPLVLVLGPFMDGLEKDALRERANELENVTIIDFDSELEIIMEEATAVIGMCGYNTFCEIVSFDKPAIYVPRTRPREEQLIRASRADVLGIAQLLDSENAKDPATMAQALRDLPDAPRPSQAEWHIDLEGLKVIGDRVETLLQDSTGKHSSPFASALSHQNATSELEV